MSGRDGGYTLAEALVALLIVSLAFAGLIQASSMLGRTDRRQSAAAEHGRQVRTFESRLRAALLPLQPIEGEAIRGNGSTLEYSCAQAECTLDAPEGTLVYFAEGRELAYWPPERARDQEPLRLEALVWRDSRGRNLAVIKLPVEHGRECQFDMISRTCQRIEPTSPAS